MGIGVALGQHLVGLGRVPCVQELLQRRQVRAAGAQVRQQGFQFLAQEILRALGYALVIQLLAQVSVIQIRDRAAQFLDVVAQALQVNVLVLVLVDQTGDCLWAGQLQRFGLQLLQRRRVLRLRCGLHIARVERLKRMSALAGSNAPELPIADFTCVGSKTTQF